MRSAGLRGRWPPPPCCWRFGRPRPGRRRRGRRAVAVAGPSRDRSARSAAAGHPPKLAPVRGRRVPTRAQAPQGPAVLPRRRWVLCPPVRLPPRGRNDPALDGVLHQAIPLAAPPRPRASRAATRRPRSWRMPALRRARRRQSPSPARPKRRVIGTPAATPNPTAAPTVKADREANVKPTAKPTVKPTPSRPQQGPDAGSDSQPAPTPHAGSTGHPAPPHAAPVNFVSSNLRAR